LKGGPPDVLAEYADLDGAPMARYVYAGSQRIAMIDSTGAVYYYLNDHLGSAGVVINSSGTAMDKYRYEPFGNPGPSSSNLGQNYRYTGKPQDEELGLNIYYYGARYYDPYVCRFLSIDPLASKYLSWGPYVYCYDNPLKFKDPNGEAGFLALAGGGAAIGFTVDMLHQAHTGGAWYDYNNYDFSRVMWKSCFVSAGKGALVGATFAFAGPTYFKLTMLQSFGLSGGVGMMGGWAGNALLDRPITARGSAYDFFSAGLCGVVHSAVPMLFGSPQVAYHMSRILGSGTTGIGVKWSLQSGTTAGGKQVAKKVGFGLANLLPSNSNVPSGSVNQQGDVRTPGSYPVRVIMITDAPQFPKWVDPQN